MIRLARKSDWPEISRISTRSGYEDYINRIGPGYLEDGEVLVFEESSIQAFAKIEYLMDNSAWFSGLRVDPDYWRNGLGTSLTEAGIERAVEKGCNTVRLLIYEDNFRSLKLVDKLGFKNIRKYTFFEGIPDITTLCKETRQPSGLVNLGWKFARIPETGNFEFPAYNGNGWTFMSTGENTFEILSMGSGPVNFLDGGFTCLSGDMGYKDHHQFVSDEKLSSGFILEKNL